METEPIRVGIDKYPTEKQAGIVSIAGLRAAYGMIILAGALAGTAVFQGFAEPLPSRVPQKANQTSPHATGSKATATAEASHPIAPIPSTEEQILCDLPPGRVVDYLSDVSPILTREGCATSECHGTRIGKGGLHLSLFGADPAEDYNALTREARGSRIDCVHPASSLLLQKITGTIAGGCKERIAPGSTFYHTIFSWIADGAPYSAVDRPDLQGITITPAFQVMTRGKSLPIRVWANYSDGSRKDVTPLTIFWSTDPSCVAVDDAGVITAHSFGQAYVVATYRRQFGMTRILTPQSLPMPFPQAPINNQVDKICLDQLKKMGMPPSDICSDPVFLRRVYLDTIGVLPTPEEAQAFLNDKSPNRRSHLIDQLLQRDEFADYWALKWSDLLRIKSEYPVRLWPKAVVTYYRWVRDSIAEDKPYDQFVTEMLTSSGSNFCVGPANYYRAVNNKDPQTFAETTALLFMGARLSCARCHGDPYENWNLDDDAGMAAIFAGMRFKNTLEWKEEIVFTDTDAVFRNPKTGTVVQPKALDGTELSVPKDGDVRVAFAQWLTSPKNPWFARAIVNRIWFWLIGRGLVNEPDDMRPTNPPSNPELLDYLANELVANHYDLKTIYRLILNSRTYQLSSATNRWNAADDMGFSHYLVKRLPAEELLDAVDRVTGTSESFSSAIPEPYTHLPWDTRAEQVADGSIENNFLSLMGRPPRDTPYESDRCSRTTMRQALHLMNSNEMEAKIQTGGRINSWIKTGKTNDQIVDDLYLAAFSRVPTAGEKQVALTYIGQDPKNRTNAVQDLMWAILNTKEFLFNH